MMLALTFYYAISIKYTFAEMISLTFLHECPLHYFLFHFVCSTKLLYIHPIHLDEILLTQLTIKISNKDKECGKVCSEQSDEL